MIITLYISNVYTFFLDKDMCFSATGALDQKNVAIASQRTNNITVIDK